MTGERRRAVQAGQHRGDTADGEDAAEQGPRQGGGGRTGRGVAQRLDRPDRRRPPGRHEGRDHGDDRADQQAHDDGARLDLERRAREAEPERPHQGVQARGHAGTEDDAEGGRPEPEDGGLEQEVAQDLAARRPDRTQQRDLPRALGDDHREGVPDHERPDEQRDPREGEEEHPDDLEAVGDGVGRLLRRGGAGQRLHAVGQGGRDACRQLGVVDVAGGAHDDLVEGARLAQHALRGRGVEVGGGGPAQVVLVAVADGPDHGELLGRTAEQDRDAGAERQVVLRGRASRRPRPHPARRAREPDRSSTSPRRASSAVMP